MKGLIAIVDRTLQRFMPDPFVIAILLTAITFGLCICGADPASVKALSRSDPRDVIQFWGDGFMGLAEFTLQMAMILIGGYVVAVSRPVKFLLRSLIKWVETPVEAVLFCTLTAIAASSINWGFGLVVGGIVALEVGRKLPQVPFRVLVAGSYSGFLVWHGGLSSSIPLALNSPGNVSTELTGRLIPLAETMFSRLNLIAMGSMFLLLPLISLLNLKLAGNEPSHFSDESNSVPDKISDDPPTIWINRSLLPVLILLGLAAFYWFVKFDLKQFSLNLNSIIFVFFMAGLLLHGSPNAFINAVTEATPKVAPILIQYPLYAGIMAMLTESGMADQISAWFVAHSTQTTLPLMTFYSAGLLNLLIPSGGGQWAVQAPIVVEAAQQLDVAIPRVAMAVAWGDAWTNMLQPFWAIPLLSIAGLGIKDIIGFCLVTLIASGVVLSLIFLLL